MAAVVQLKDHINSHSLEQLANVLRQAYPSFDCQGFLHTALQGLEPLELKARIQHVIAAMAVYLPNEFSRCVIIFQRVARYWPRQTERNWNSYAAWPVIDFVAVYGIDYPQQAVPLLAELTELFTAEFAIRPFIEQHFAVTYPLMLGWTQHENAHVRRLASEGLRPRLPWADQLKQLKHDPTPLWPILAQLKSDNSEYVRRSVANNLNDISKDHPQQVMAVCRCWLTTADKKTQWVVRHGLRSLVKQGYAEVYPLLGYSAKVDVQIAKLSVDKTVLQLGENLELQLLLQTRQAASMVVDYRVGYQRANGQLRFKVFKWKNTHTEAGVTVKLIKQHPFKALSTRRFYAGEHWIECMVNGKVIAKTCVSLLL